MKEQLRHIVFIEKLDVTTTTITALAWVARTHASTAQAPAGFVARIGEVAPHLGEHLCIGEDVSFDEEIAHTNTAHLFEHLVLETISVAEKRSEDIAGHTSWDHSDINSEKVEGERSGFLQYSIRVATVDTFTGVGAFAIAQELLDWAWTGSGERPSLEGLVEELLGKKEEYLEGGVV